MSYCSTHVNDKGEVMCISCRRKFNLSRVVTCVYCDRFVCRACASKKNGFDACKSRK